MLRGLHKASSTWLGKAVMAVIMGFLVISFAIWGIGDIFRGFGRNAVATIGDNFVSSTMTACSSSDVSWVDRLRPMTHGLAASTDKSSDN
jgi:hypothetical protein